MIGWARYEKGLQFIALFEAAKGGIVLVAGFGLLSLIHRDVEAMAEQIAEHLHLNPASHYPRIFIEAASKLDDGRLWLFAGLAFLYATFRFVEAYGLWYMRRWAEWLAVVSGGIYMPLEVYELVKLVTWPRILALVANALIVAYLASVLVAQKKAAAVRESGRLAERRAP